jgi:hypothetical protein
MNHTYLYRIPIFYMLLYTVAILISGVWLFLLSQGLSELRILETITRFIDLPAKKSYYGLVEVTTPHLASMGILIFLVTHFLLFSTKVSKRFSKKVSIVLFIMAFVNIGVYYLISSGILSSGLIKLLSLSGFITIFVYSLSLVAFSLSSNHTKETKSSRLS